MKEQDLKELTNMSDATANLCAHSGAIEVKREDLQYIPAPPRTETHTPIEHARLVEHIEYALWRNNMDIVEQRFATMRDGLMLFGTLVLRHQTRDDFSFAMGLRTANDKTMSVQLIAGMRVFVCDNMAFSGDAVVLARKHTSRINIPLEIGQGVERALVRFNKLDERTQELKEYKLTENNAKAIILDAQVKEVMPQYLTAKIYKEYFEPQHVEFVPRTMWSLHNAFTEVFKQLKPNIAMQSTMALGKVFGL